MVSLVLLITGCFENSSVVEIEEPEMIEEVSETQEEPAIKITRQGPKDRLPGSLKWGSVVAYTSGVDFAQEEGGLAAVSILQIQTESGSKTTIAVEAGANDKSSEKADTGDKQTNNSTTTDVVISTPGTKTEISVDGTIKYEGTTIIGDDENPWYTVE